MPRKLTWNEGFGLAGWGYADSAWLVQAPSAPAGKSSEETLRMIDELQKNREFASHVCIHSRKNKS
jgi:hypothetical protein